MRRFYKSKRYWRVSFAVRPVGFAVLGVAVVGVLSLTVLRTCMALEPVYQTANQAIDQPFVMRLNQALKHVDVAKITIQPAIDGEWEYRKASIVGSDELVFTPANDFRANTTYTVASVAVDRMFMIGDDTLQSVSFKTESAPGVANAGLIAMTDGDTIAADETLTVILKSASKRLRDLQLITTPELALTRVSSDDTTFTWKIDGLLPQGQPLTIQVYDAKNDVTLATRKVTVAAAPTVASFNKPHHFTQGETAVISFAQPMDKASTKVVFDVEGVGEWRSTSEYAFTPSKVAVDARYTWKVAQGARSLAGGIVTAELTGTFTTTGPVNVVGMSPYGYELSQAHQNIRFTFDQPVDHASAQSKFSVNAGKVNGFSWSGNTMIASVSNMGFQRTVTASVAAGVKNAGFGAPSNRGFGVSFTTEVVTIKYNVPAYRQQHSATCVAASLRMILAYHGIGTDDMAIVNRMGYAPTKLTDGKWDDPQQMFVGSVDGSISSGTAAGTDAQPAARVAQQYGRGASAVTGINVHWIAQQLAARRLVIMFGAMGNVSQTITWQTPSGRTEVMNKAGHARTVIGVKGDPSNPIGFWVNDPLNGYTAYWTAGQLQANINLDPYRQAVSVW